MFLIEEAHWVYAVRLPHQLFLTFAACLHHNQLPSQTSDEGLLLRPGSNAEKPDIEAIHGAVCYLLPGDGDVQGASLVRSHREYRWIGAWHSVSVMTHYGSDAARCLEFNGWALAEQDQANDIYMHFQAYKRTVPCMGAIFLDPSMNYVLLVKGVKKGSSWGFPKGKIGKVFQRHCSDIALLRMI